MNGLDPYDVLGVPHNAPTEDIKKAYKGMLMKTHPDKLGDARYFMLVHEAFASIQRHRKDLSRCSNMPQAPQSYAAASQQASIPEPTKMKNFTRERFNRYFDENRIDALDPYSSGYSQYMVSSKKNREDIEEARTNSVYIPTRDVVVYKEPEFLASSSTVHNCYELGKQSIDDFTGGGGTDIMKAFVHSNGDHVDTVKRYSSVDHILSDRATESLAMTDKERRAAARREKRLAKMEALRLQSVREMDTSIDERYINLHRVLH